ncbi:MAG: hypothetical protein AB1916_09520, partial [Thermodesulfobacteriota bacterium]
MLGKSRVRTMEKDGGHCDGARIPGVELLGCGRVARRLLPVGLVFSMALHLAVVAGGLWLAAVLPHAEPPSGIYEVDIVRPEPPPPAAAPAPEPPPEPAAQPEPDK